MARELPNFVYFAYYFGKKHLLTLDPYIYQKKIWPAMRFELCTSDHEGAPFWQRQVLKPGPQDYMLRFG
jgi:hypothetical protein